LSPRIVTFDWDEANVEHIARHDVLPHEVEEVFLHQDAYLQDFGWRDSEKRYKMIGETADGRILQIVFVIRKGSVRTATAYTAKRRARTLYADRRRP
jgi:uncharacterized DUF497 family protein